MAQSTQLAAPDAALCAFQLCWPVLLLQVIVNAKGGVEAEGLGELTAAVAEAQKQAEDGAVWKVPCVGPRRGCWTVELRQCGLSYPAGPLA
jgi:hypothetical protein